MREKFGRKMNKKSKCEAYTKPTISVNTIYCESKMMVGSFTEEDKQIEVKTDNIRIQYGGEINGEDNPWTFE